MKDEDIKKTLETRIVKLESLVEQREKILQSKASWGKHEDRVLEGLKARYFN